MRLPLPVLDYDLGWSGLSTPAGLTTVTGRSVTVTALPQPDLPPAPAPAIRVRSMAVSYSTDDGAHWLRAARAGHQGVNSATVRLPRLPRGTVLSLRTEMETTDDVRFDQSIVRAAVVG